MTTPNPRSVQPEPGREESGLPRFSCCGVTLLEVHATSCLTGREQAGREPTAEQEGRVAYQTGVPQHQNPYAATFAQSEARLAWLTGWLAEEGRDTSRHDDAADELCAVLDGFEAVQGQPGESLTVTRQQVERWARQVGRALLVLDAEAGR